VQPTSRARLRRLRQRGGEWEGSRQFSQPDASLPPLPALAAAAADTLSRPPVPAGANKHPSLVRIEDSRLVRATPWPSGRWRAWRRIDTGHAGRLHSHERARGHVEPRCRSGGNAGRGKGCRRRHRSGSGSPASRDADGRGLHSAVQRTSNRAGRWQADGPPQKEAGAQARSPTGYRCARSPRPTRGGGGW